MLKEPRNRCYEGRKVFGNSGPYEVMSGIEIPMRELVPHAGDIDPRDIGLAGEEVGIDSFDCFTDLD